eukprot:gene8963-12085_t
MSALNINVGVLGHVDSGKTSLVKALSTSLSTASLDKNPQSQQRGITLDLGFSSFSLPIPPHIQSELSLSSPPQSFDLLQFTLVDCPGHASLIRTIIGGAQIIDMILLVIDANKGIQTQTAECIVIGEITTDNLIIVMNKIDLIPLEEREAKLSKMTKRIKKVLSTTKFHNAPMIYISAVVGGEKVASISSNNTNLLTSANNKLVSIGMDELIETINCHIKLPSRNINGPFYYSIDHCFPIKGHGTVLTGTILNGSISINNIIEIPHIQIQRKVKSMQMFHKSVKSAKQGDRVAICVTNLDASLIERSIAATPSTVPLISSVICMIKKVRFFKLLCKSNSKYHITVGHSTIIASVMFFGHKEIFSKHLKKRNNNIDGNKGIVENGSNNDVVTSHDWETACDDLDDNKEEIDAVIDIHQPTLQSLIDSTVTNEGSNKTTEIKPDKDAVIEIVTATNQVKSTKNNKKTNKNTKHNNDSNEKISANNANKTNSTSSLRQSTLNGSYHSSFPSESYDYSIDYEYQQDIADITPNSSVSDGSHLVYGYEPVQWALIQFQQPIYCPLGSLIIGSRLDADTKEGGSKANQCRLAFYGPIIESISDSEINSKVKIFNWKVKECHVFKLTDVRNGGLCYEVIGWKLVSEEGGSIQHFLGMKVETEQGVVGIIMNAFGSDGKFRVKFSVGSKISRGSKLILRYKRYIYDKTKAMNQDGIDETNELFLAQQSEQSIHTNISKISSFYNDGVDSTSKDINSTVSSIQEECIDLNHNIIDSFGDTKAASMPIHNEDKVNNSSQNEEKGINISFVDKICGAFKMEENIRAIIESNKIISVIGPNGEVGELIGPFGKLGKCKILFRSGCLGPVNGIVKIIQSLDE